MGLLNIKWRKGGGHLRKTGYGTEGILVPGGFHVSLDDDGKTEGEEFLRRQASS